MSKWSGRNALYYGDNLAVLRESIPDESVDLIYLDPPFNSNASHNMLFKSPDGDQSAAQIEAFDDTWHWTDVAESAYREVLTSGNSDASEMLRAMRSFLAETDVLACMTFPPAHRVKLHSTNPLGRLNGEIKRRTEVVGIFPNEAAIIRLLGAILLEQNDECSVQRSRYLSLETIAILGDNPLVSLPDMAA